MLLEHIQILQNKAQFFTVATAMIMKQATITCSRDTTIAIFVGL